MPRWGSEYEDCGDRCDCDDEEDLGGVAHHDENAVYACDGHFGAILKAYREYLQSGDRDWLEAMWPRVKLALEYAIERWDDDRDGVLSGAQWNTYDCVIFGHSSFTTTLYLAALRAVEQMAITLGDSDQAASARELFEKGATNLDAELFNGEYYVQTVDHDRYGSMQYGDGCHADQLLGQWWAHSLGLGHLLPSERVGAAVKAIHEHNFRRDLRDHVQRPRVFVKPEEPGVLLCTWPNGGELDDPTNYAHETAWTGVEYAVAGQLIYEGLVDEGLEIVTAIRSRQNGRIRNPWNEVECGDHYARALASWNLLDALSGYVYDAGAGSLTVGPRMSPESYQAFFIGNRGWGSYSQEVKGGVLSASLGIVRGEVELGELTLALPEGFVPESVGVSLAGDGPAGEMGGERRRTAAYVGEPGDDHRRGGAGGHGLRPIIQDCASRIFDEDRSDRNRASGRPANIPANPAGRPTSARVLNSPLAATRPATRKRQPAALISASAVRISSPLSP